MLHAKDHTVTSAVDNFKFKRLGVVTVERCEVLNLVCNYFEASQERGFGVRIWVSSNFLRLRKCLKCQSDTLFGLWEIWWVCIGWLWAYWTRQKATFLGF